jgi:protein TonB
MSRRLRIAILISVALHVMVLAAFVPILRRTPPAADKPDKEAAVELLMVEQKGAGQTTVPPPTPPTPPSPPVAAATPQQAAPPPAPPAPVPPPAAPSPPARPLPPLPDDADGEPVPKPPAPAPTKPPAAQLAANAAPHPATPPPTPQAPPAEVPVFNLGGTDSESNAIASGDQVIPASPDDKARNRPPIYPQEAAMLRQEGSVVVVIHVSPYGTTQGVDILQGSGHVLLDHAVLDAVRRWHFLPAVKDGQPVPFDMPMRFVFGLN